MIVELSLLKDGMWITKVFSIEIVNANRTLKPPIDIIVDAVESFLRNDSDLIFIEEADARS